MPDDTSGITDSIEIVLNPDPTVQVVVDGEVKGPDPDHWGAHEDRHAADVAAGKFGTEPQIDGVNVKGPNVDVWGEYEGYVAPTSAPVPEE